MQGKEVKPVAFDGYLGPRGPLRGEMLVITGGANW